MKLAVQLSPGLVSSLTVEYRNASSQIWKASTTSFVTFVSANLSDYKLACTEKDAGSGYFEANADAPTGWDQAVFRNSSDVVVGTVSRLTAEEITSIQSGLSTFNATTDAVNVGKINNSTAAAANLAAMYAAGVSAGTINDVSPAAGSFLGSSGLSTDDGAYAGQYLAFTSGPNAGRWRKITSYTGATRAFAFSGVGSRADAPFPEEPSNGDGFLIGGRAG